MYFISTLFKFLRSSNFSNTIFIGFISAMCAWELVIFSGNLTNIGVLSWLEWDVYDWCRWHVVVMVLVVHVCIGVWWVWPCRFYRTSLTPAVSCHLSISLMLFLSSNLGHSPLLHPKWWVAGYWTANFFYMNHLNIKN